MIKSLLKLGAAGALVAAVAGLPLQVAAQTTNKAPVEKKAPAEKSESGAKKSRTIPFEGNLTSVDKAAKTIKVDKRTFEITSETKIYKDDKPAALEDGVANEYVTGSYRKADDGKLVARSVYYGGKGKAKAPEKKAEKKKEK